MRIEEFRVVNVYQRSRERSIATCFAGDPFELSDQGRHGFQACQLVNVQLLPLI